MHIGKNALLKNTIIDWKIAGGSQYYLKHI